MFWLSVVFNCNVYILLKNISILLIGSAFRATWFPLHLSGNTGLETILESVKWPIQSLTRKRKYQKCPFKALQGWGWGGWEGTLELLSFGATILIGFGTRDYCPAIKKVRYDTNFFIRQKPNKTMRVRKKMEITFNTAYNNGSVCMSLDSFCSNTFVLFWVGV